MAECSLSGNSVPSIGDSPHQPQSFAFPNRQFGQKFVVSRSFQANWFKSWKWLHYDEESDTATPHLSKGDFTIGRMQLSNSGLMKVATLIKKPF